MTVYSIKQKKRNELEGFLSKKGIRPNDLENSQSDYFAKKKKNKQTNTKAYSEENTQGKAGQSIKDIMEL